MHIFDVKMPQALRSSKLCKTWRRLWHEAHCEVKMSKHAKNILKPFLAAVAAQLKFQKHFSLGQPLEVEMLKMHMPFWREAHSHERLGPMFEVRMWFWVAGRWDSASWKREGFVKPSKRVCKDACHLVGAEKESFGSDVVLGGQRADSMRGAALWSNRLAGLLR